MFHIRQLRCPNGKSVCTWNCRLWFDSGLGQNNDVKIGIHTYPAWRPALKEQSGEQANKFTRCPVRKSRPVAGNS